MRCILISPAVKKILILTATGVGYGHIKAAESLQYAFEQISSSQVTILDSITFFSRIFDEYGKALYLKSIKYVPFMWALLFKHSDDHRLIHRFETLEDLIHKKAARRLIEIHDPDVIISTYPFNNGVISRELKQMKPDARFVTVITDSISVHHVWLTGEVDAFIVANDDTAAVLSHKGVSSGNIHTLGFPVDHRFSEYESQENFWQNYGLSHTKKTILLVFNSVPSRSALKYLKELPGDYADRYQLFIVTGHNEELLKKVQSMNLPLDFSVIGWTHDLPMFICESDIVVTKAGGSMIMECLAAKKPVIITQILPGQEAGNADLIIRHRLGVVMGKGRSLAWAIMQIESGNLGKREYFTGLSYPDAAIDIARYCYSLI